MYNLREKKIICVYIKMKTIHHLEYPIGTLNDERLTIITKKTKKKHSENTFVLY